MKKLFFIALIVTFSGVASAQIQSKTASDISKKAIYQEKQTSSKMEITSDLQGQVKDQLVNNDELGEEAIKFLKSDAKSVSSLKKIYNENKGVVSDVMKAVMKDPTLSKTVMDWVSSDPQVTQQVMKLIGM